MKYDPDLAAKIIWATFAAVICVIALYRLITGNFY